jgi:hypothetical protein
MLGVDMAEQLPEGAASLPEVTIPVPGGSWRREVAATTEDMWHLTEWLEAKSEDTEAKCSSMQLRLILGQRGTLSRVGLA